ncbi:arsenate reductase [Limnohabitans sp. DCL3]|uniref:arsenate reductase n=1 Tax=Limnohabitans sp. DCL3 TaxID=3374103 RepID=UPI003A8938A5
MHLIVYGIPNCDSVKKARAWLSEQGLEASFHDFKKQGVPEAALDTWLADVGWQTLLNRKGTTWRKLDPAVQTGVTDSASAKAVMQAHASTIKRPVIAWPSGKISVGYTPDRWPL